MSITTRARGLIIVTLLIAGCGSDPGFNEAVDFIPEEGAVQFANLIADSPELTVFHGLTSTRVPFPIMSLIESRFEDDYDWRVAYPNRTGGETTVASGQSQPIRKDVLTTYLISGTIAQPVVEIVDHLLVPLEDRPDGQLEVWFTVNTSRFSMLDIYYTDLGDELSSSQPIVTLNSGNTSELIPVSSVGDKQLRITEAGADALLFDSGLISLLEKTQSLFAVVDDFGPDGNAHVDMVSNISGVPLVDESQPSEYRVGNFSTSEPIEVIIGSTSFPSQDRTETSTYANIESGTQALSITTDGSILEQRETVVTVNTFQTLLVFDDENAESLPAANSLSTIDQIRFVTDRSLLQFVNGTEEAVDLFALIDGGTIADTLPFLNDVLFEASATVEISPGQVQFAVTNSDASETLATIDTTMVEGVSYLLVFDTEAVLHLLLN